MNTIQTQQAAEPTDVLEKLVDEDTVCLESITLKEAARLLKVTKNTACALARQHSIPAIRVGQRWRVPLAQFKDYLNGKWKP